MGADKQTSTVELLWNFSAKFKWRFSISPSTAIPDVLVTILNTDIMELKQFDSNFNRFSYKIEESGIRLIKKGISTSSDTFVNFEDIGSKIIKENKRKLV